MRKVNRKGFMLAEVVVVASVIATVLVTMYIAVNRMSSAYELRNKYYDLDAMYLSMEANDMLLRNNSSFYKNTSAVELKNNYVYNNSYYYTSSDYYAFNVTGLEAIKSSNNDYDIKFYYAPYTYDGVSGLENLDNINETFKEYASYLKDKFDYEELKDSEMNSYTDCSNYDKYYDYPIPLRLKKNEVVVTPLVFDNESNYKITFIETSSSTSFKLSNSYYLYVFVTEMCDKNDSSNCKYYALKVGKARYCSLVYN